MIMPSNDSSHSIPCGMSPRTQACLTHLTRFGTRPLRAGAAVAALAVVAGCGGADSSAGAPPRNSITPAAGGTAASADAKVTLAFPPGAVTAPITVTIAPIPVTGSGVVAGSAYEFGPDGTQFAQPVALSLAYDATNLPAGTPQSALRVAKRVGAEWVSVEEGLSVDSAAGRVKASIRSFSSYAIQADPCAARTVDITRSSTGSPGQTSGVIANDQCRLSPNRFGAAFRIPPTRYVIGSGTGANFILKEATGSALTGRVYYTFPRTSKAYYLVASPNLPVEIVAVGDSGATGASFSFTYDSTSAQQQPGAFSCDDYAPIIVPGSTLADGINRGSACKYAVKFSPFPSAIGQPLLARLYLAPLAAGKAYTIAIDSYQGIGTSGFDASLTVFRGGAVVAQSVTAAGSFGSSRTVSFTASATGNYLVEVASGQPATTTGQGWINPEGTFRLRITAQ